MPNLPSDTSQAQVSGGGISKEDAEHGLREAGRGCSGGDGQEGCAAEHKGRKKAKKEDAAAVVEEDEAVPQPMVAMQNGSTQGQQFKKRALKVKEDLESNVPGVSVKINPEKPRRRCLEIREEGGEVFISLLTMPRPFTAMRKLDMDEVIKDIAEKLSLI